MSRGFSLYLDGLRFLAAVLVLLSHFAYPRFSDGRWLWVRELNLGSDAVVLFFVLSGLVISHVVAAKPGGACQYAFDRLTRLISVAFPALLLGFGLDCIGAAIAPQIYDGWMYNPLPLWELLLRGLTFSNEWGGIATRLGTNGPYWSLSYEAAYYALFGIAVYTQGPRRIALIALGAWCVGLNILLLMPAWLVGVGLHRMVVFGVKPSKRAALYLAIVPVLFYVGALAYDLPQLLRAPIAAYQPSLRFSDEFIWNLALAVLVGAHLWGMANLLSGQGRGRAARSLRWLAAGSFSLYLLHYPVLQVLAGIGLASHTLAEDVVLLGATGIACFLFAEVFERRLPVFRRWLQPLLRMRLGQTQPTQTNTIKH
ncbi:acyltransferase family protein [Epibacterium sp. SM1979]|uniref:Acyltransferase family protein n=1 Tax=Tritonibacter litoralis TaxID=2662264 RepID=A0A843YGJ6_9RHOB|nr:acyltransferase [Tritonibacter litoralis]MQQ07897.1 acyltransferase family protein [Tritonibacter litoralis]